MTELDKAAVARAVRRARTERGIEWAQIAEAIDRPLVWTVAALLGNHPVPLEQAEVVCELLGLAPEAAVVLAEQPYRTTDPLLASDPTVYRLHEAVNVYGAALKELIHEEFGDGIMSAINFQVSFARRPDPGGDRVQIVLDGKFLPYQW